VLGSCGQPPGIKISIKNDTGAELKNVRLMLSGQKVSIANIPNGETGVVSVRPNKESGLDLSFIDKAGLERVEAVGVYLEPSFCGSVTVVIAPDGSLTRTANIRAGML
jgi:hypothetical protein